MVQRDPELKRLGWSAWFERQSGGAPDGCLARVAAVDRDLLLLMGPGGAFRARLTGSYRHRHPLAQDQPCVGDWVRVEERAAGDPGQVAAVLERRTVLRRKAAGDAVEFQMIAANVDTVIVVLSSHYDFNVKRLERYLVMATDGGATACILLTKTDLVDPAVVAGQRAAIADAGITAPVLALSSVTREGIGDLLGWMQPGMTMCFVGSSGVGKSTLINHLVGREVQVTKRVSGSGEGRHTTVRRELIVLEGGALVIDNPGMREFGVLASASGLDGGFGDIGAIAAGCRYRNCTHTTEPGCAVREALDASEVGAGHYENYVKLRRESEFNELSYVERRRKDRSFGKFLKQAKKDLPNA